MSLNIATLAAATGTVQSCTVPFPYFPADGSIPITATAVIVDDSKTPAPGVTVTWTPSADATPNSPTSVTNTNGVATMTFTFSGETISQATIKATTTDDTTGKTASLYVIPPELPEPHVSNASQDDDWTLNYYDVNFGVQASVPLVPDVQVGYIVNLCWGSQKRERIIENPQLDLPMVVSINNDDFPGGLADGAHPVFFYMTDAADNPSVSSGLPIVVDNGGQTIPTLPAPQIPVANDGYINRHDSYDVQVEIVYANMAIDDVVTLYWQATNSTGQTLSNASGSWVHQVASGENAGINMQIPQELFYPEAGEGYEGTVHTWYTTESAEGMLALSKTKTVMVDTVPPLQEIAKP